MFRANWVRWGDKIQLQSTLQDDLQKTSLDARLKAGRRSLERTPQPAEGKRGSAGAGKRGSTELPAVVNPVHSPMQESTSSWALKVDINGGGSGGEDANATGKAVD